MNTPLWDVRIRKGDEVRIVKIYAVTPESAQAEAGRRYSDWTVLSAGLAADSSVVFRMNRESRLCAECRDTIVPRSKTVTAKDGAVFHQRCWSNC